MDNIENTTYWAKRSPKDQRKDWVRGSEHSWIMDYWQSANHPHRQLILRIIKNLRPKSLLEIGCNCGPNLILVESELGIKLAGTDVNKDAVEFAQKALPKITIKLHDARNPLPFKNKSFDMVLVDAVLMYFNPKEAIDALNNIVKVADKSIVIIDWYNESKEGIIRMGHWARNYTKLLEERGFKVKEIKLNKQTWPSENWAKYGRLFVAMK